MDRARMCAIAVMLSLAHEARAQTISVGSNVERAQPSRPSSEKPSWINRADCLADDVLNFPVILGGPYAGLTLEVWAGAADCTDPAERAATGGAQCWRVYRSVSVSSPAVVSIKARAVVGPVLLPTLQRFGAEVCALGVGPQPLMLYFMLVDSSETIRGTTAAWSELGVDTQPPDPPRDVVVALGDTRIHLQWSPVTSDDLVGFRVFCHAARGFGRSGLDAAAALRDGAIPPLDVCGSALVFGTFADPKYLCGVVTGGASTSGIVEYLTNGKLYGVAVASVDEVGNVGELSDVECTTPESASLGRDGALNGGCACSASSSGSTASPSALAFVAVSFAIARRKNRRRSAARYRIISPAVRRREILERDCITPVSHVISTRTDTTPE